MNWKRNSGEKSSSVNTASIHNVSSLLTFSRQVAPGISLKTLAEEDAESLFAVTNANRAYLRRWMPWLDGTKTAADSLTFIQSMRVQASNHTGFTAAIRVENQIVGVAGFHTIDWNNRIATMGYWLAESHQKHGIMTRAARTLIDFGFAALNVNRVTLSCAVDNQRSRAIPERLGLTHEGTLRDAEWLYTRYVDHAIYSLLQREWQVRILRAG